MHNFHGNNCDKPPSSCTPGMCKNDGQCKETENNAFTCICKEGYWGAFCEKSPGKTVAEINYLSCHDIIKRI